MNIDSLEIIEQDIEYLQKCLRLFKKRLRETSKYDNCSLVVCYRDEKANYYLSEKVEGKRVRRYLGPKDVTMRKVIQERHYIEKAIPICESNIRLLGSVLENYESIEPDDVVKQMGKAYQEQENARRDLYGYARASEWKKNAVLEKAKYPPYKPNQLKHTAVDGTMTRSKSEALIYNMLLMKNIEFVYELPTFVGNTLVLPDFSIYNSKSGKVIILEHLGMTADEEYRQEQYKKIDTFIANGYVINRDLLFSCDDSNGIIDVQTISRTIESTLKLR